MDNMEKLKAKFAETKGKYKLVKKRMKALEKILREREQKKARREFKSLQTYPNNRKNKRMVKYIPQSL